MHSSHAYGIAVVTTLAAVACGDSGTSASPSSLPSSSSRYSGLWAGPGRESGELELTIEGAPATSVTTQRRADGLGEVRQALTTGKVTGTLVLSTVAGPVTLSGTVTFEDGGISFAGTASTALGSFSCQGTVNTGVVRGTCTGADGKTRSFDLRDVAKGAPSFYCGAFEGALSGTWNMVVDSSGAAGAIFWSESLAGAAAGQVTGDALTLTFAPPASGNATGAVGGGSMNGTWNAGALGQGTFRGAAGACPSAASRGLDGGAGLPVDGGAPLDAGPPVFLGGGTKIYGYDSGTQKPGCAGPVVLTDTHAYCGSTGYKHGIVSKVPIAGGVGVVIAPEPPDTTAGALYLARSSTQLVIATRGDGYAVGELNAIYTLPLATTGSTSPTPIVSTLESAASGIAADETGIYFPTGRLLKRMDWTGAGLTNVWAPDPSKPIPLRVAIGPDVYFYAKPDAAKHTVGRVATNGGVPVFDYTLAGQPIELDAPQAMASNATHVFVVNGLNVRPVIIYAIPKAGGAAIEVARPGARILSANAMTADATHVYWATESSVARAPVGGGRIEVLANEGGSGMAVNATHVAWVTNPNLWVWKKP